MYNKGTTVYLISGTTSNDITGSVSVGNMSKFTFNIWGNTTGSMPATGLVQIHTRLDDSASWGTLYSNGLWTNNSGIVTTFNSCTQDIRATLTNRTAGQFTVVCRYSES